MAMTEYQYTKIREALVSKNIKACSSCGVPETFVVMDKFYLMPMHSTPQTTAPTDVVIPCVAISCSNCGLVNVFSIHALGIAEVLGIPGPGVAI